MKKPIAVFTAAVMILLICGCSGSQDKTEYKSDVFAMDTFMTVKAYGEKGKSAVKEAEAEIKRLEALFSVTDGGSEVSLLNRSGGKAVGVSQETAELISRSIEISDKTDGALDITVYPLVREWGFTTGDYKIPDKTTVDGLLENTGYKNINISGKTVTLKDNTEIDLGAVAKGYTADRIIEIMKKNGVTSALVNLGGNVQALGKKPDGSLWKIGIEDPFGGDDNVCTLDIENRAVVTSGNYQRYFTGEDGRRYCHIIDPSNGYPADNELVSVTVIGDSGFQCDSLATALFVMGKEKAINFCRNNRDIDAVLIDKDGNICITEEIYSAAEINGGTAPTVIKRERNEK